MAEMEKHLIGFSRARVEAVGTIEEANFDLPVIWERDERVQPFHMHEPSIDQRDPTVAEVEKMQRAHAATIATCERMLGRRLTDDEQRYIYTGFKNGRIVGHLSPPLSELIKNASREPRKS